MGEGYQISKKLNRCPAGISFLQASSDLLDYAARTEPYTAPWALGNLHFQLDEQRLSAASRHLILCPLAFNVNMSPSSALFLASESFFLLSPLILFSRTSMPLSTAALRLSVYSHPPVLTRLRKKFSARIETRALSATVEFDEANGRKHRSSMSCVTPSSFRSSIVWGRGALRGRSRIRRSWASVTKTNEGIWDELAVDMN